MRYQHVSQQKDGIDPKSTKHQLLGNVHLARNAQYHRQHEQHRQNKQQIKQWISSG